MTLETVAIVAVIAVIFMVVALFLTVIATMITETQTKRQVELHKAGLVPPGWRAGK